MTPILIIAGVLAALILFRWARTLLIFCVAAAAVWFFMTHAHAKEPEAYRCNSPPYGLSYGGYKSFAVNFSPIFPDPDPFLSKICIGKFDNRSPQRQTLYEFGLSAAFIDATPMDDLVAPVVMAIKRQIGGR